MKKYKVLAMVITLALTVTACKKEESTEQDTTTTKDTTSINSEYIHLTMVNPKTINPINNVDKSVNYVLNLVYDSLFTIDSNYNTVPQLVENYSIASDGKSIEMTLKDVKLHNGNSLTSSDVKFTIDFIKKSANSTYKTLVENIVSVSTIDNKSLKINFNEAYAFSVDTLIFPIISKDELSNLKNSDLDNYRNNMVGTGPYKIAKFNQRSDMILTLNEDYYDKGKIENAKKEINVAMVPDEEAQVSMTLALSSDITKVGLSDLSQFHQKEFEINNYEGRVYEYIILNYDNPFIKNVNFRKAIASSIDRNKIIDEAYIGNANISNFPLHTTSKYYDKDLKYYDYNIETAENYLNKIESIESNDTQGTIEKNSNEQADLQENNSNSNNIESTNEDNNETTKADENDKEKSKSDSKPEFNLKQELKDLDLKILVNKDIRERVRAAYIIKDNLSEIGVKSTVVELKDKELSDALDKKEYDLALVGWELSIVPDSTDIIKYSGYMDDKINNYINSLRISTNETNTKGIYKSIQKHTRDNVAFISLLINDDYLITNKRIEGNLSPNDFDIYEGIYQLDLEK
ncbi:MAG: ABC transporter substrate-binding protein [Paraclostridium sp.]